MSVKLHLLNDHILRIKMIPGEDTLKEHLGHQDRAFSIGLNTKTESVRPQRLVLNYEDALSRLIQFRAKPGPPVYIQVVLKDVFDRDKSSPFLKLLTLCTDFSLKNCSVGVVERLISYYLSFSSRDRVKNLVGFKVSQSSLTSTSLAMLINDPYRKRGFDSVESLQFSFCQSFSNLSLFYVLNSNLRSLKELNISYTSIDGDGLLQLSGSAMYKQLLKLNILGIKKDWKSFELFLQIENPNLKEIKFDNLRYLEVCKFDKLYIHKRFRGLEVLHFEGVEIHETGHKNSKVRRSIDTDSSDNFQLGFSNLHVLSYPNLRVLRLIDVILEVKFFRQLTVLEFTKQLTEMDLTQSIFRDIKGLKQLLVHPHIGNLEILNLSYTQIDDETLTLASVSHSLKKLREINIEGCIGISSRSLKQILEQIDLIPRLERINIRFIPNMFDTAIKYAATRLVVQNYKHLRVIDMQECVSISSLSLVYLLQALTSQVISLEQLVLKGTNFCDEGLRVISKCPNVQASLFKLNMAKCKRLTSHGIAAFFRNYQFLQLEHISLDETTFDDVCAKELSKCEPKYMQPLLKLKFKGCVKITEQGINSILEGSNFKNLYHIGCERTRFSDANLVQLAVSPSLPTLTNLLVKHCYHITELGLLNFLGTVKNLNPNFRLSKLLSNFQQLFNEKLVQKLLTNPQLNIKGLRMLDLSTMMLNTQYLLQLLESTKIPVFENVEIIRFNTTKLDDHFLIEFFKYYIRYFPRVHKIECFNAQFVTPAFVDNFFALMTDEFKLPLHFDFSNFIFIENEHRLTSQSIKSYSSIRIKDQKYSNCSFVDLRDNRKVTPEFLLSLPKSKILSTVNVLNLSGSLVDESFFEELVAPTNKQNVANLVKIEIERCPNLTTNCLTTIVKCTHFHELFDFHPFFKLRNIFVDDVLKAMALNVKYARNLTYVDLQNYTNLGVGSGLTQLCSISETQIRVIDIRNTSYGDTALAIIADSQGLKKLEKLLIEGCVQITEAGLCDIVAAKKNRFTDTFDIYGFLQQMPHLVTDAVAKLLVPIHCRFLMQVRELNLKGFLNLGELQLTSIVRSCESDVLEYINLRKLPNLKEETLMQIHENEKIRMNLQVLLLDNKRSDGSSNFLSADKGIINAMGKKWMRKLDYQYFLYKNRDMIENDVLIKLSTLNTGFLSNGKPLTYINLSRNLIIHDSAIVKLLCRDTVTFLNTLDISQTMLGINTIVEISKSNYLKNLENLILFDCPNIQKCSKEQNFLKVLFLSTQLPNLNMQLILHWNSYLMDDESVEALTKGPHMHKMQFINLRHCAQLRENGQFAMHKLGGCNMLIKVRQINVNRTLINDDALQTLFQSPYLRDLEEMHIKHTPLITSKGLLHVIGLCARLRNFDILKFIDQKRPLINNQVLEEIAKENILNKKIKYLSFADCIQLTADGLKQFFEMTDMNGIDIFELNLQNTRINDQFLEGLYKHTHFTQLNTLNVLGCKYITQNSISYLIKSPVLLLFDHTMINQESLKLYSQSVVFRQRVNYLNLEGSMISSRAIQKFCKSDHCINLISLNISRTKIDDEGIKSITNSKYMSNLQKLHIEGLHISSHSLKAFMISTTLSSIFSIESILSVFRVEHPEQITDTDMTMLASNEAKHLRRMNYLNLSGFTKISSFGIMSLADSQDACFIEIWDLSGTQIDDPAIFAISQSHNLKSLRKLYIQDCPRITPVSLNYLALTKNLSLLFRFDAILNDALTDQMDDDDKRLFQQQQKEEQREQMLASSSVAQPLETSAETFSDAIGHGSSAPLFKNKLSSNEHTKSLQQLQLQAPPDLTSPRHQFATATPRAMSKMTPQQSTRHLLMKQQHRDSIIQSPAMAQSPGLSPGQSPVTIERFNDSMIEALQNSAYLSQLNELYLDCQYVNQVKDKPLTVEKQIAPSLQRFITMNKNFRFLRKLVLFKSVNITDDFFLSLAKSVDLPNLEELYISKCNVTALYVVHIFGSKTLPRFRPDLLLKHLIEEDTIKVNNPIMARLSESTMLLNVEVLDLSDCVDLVTIDKVKEPSVIYVFPRFELAFAQHESTDFEILRNPWLALAKSPYTMNIKQLILTGCMVTESDMNDFIRYSRNFSNLIYLNLLQCQLISEFTILSLITGDFYRKENLRYSRQEQKFHIDGIFPQKIRRFSRYFQMNRVLCENSRLYDNYFTFEAFRTSDYFKVARSLYLNFDLERFKKSSYDETVFDKLIDDPYIANKKCLIVRISAKQANVLKFEERLRSVTHFILENTGVTPELIRNIICNNIISKDLDCQEMFNEIRSVNIDNSESLIDLMGVCQNDIILPMVGHDDGKFKYATLSKDIIEKLSEKDTADANASSYGFKYGQQLFTLRQLCIKTEGLNKENLKTLFNYPFLANLEVLEITTQQSEKFDDVGTLEVLANSSIQKLRSLVIPKITAAGIKHLRESQTFDTSYDPMKLINHPHLMHIEIQNIFQELAQWSLLTNTKRLELPVSSKFLGNKSNPPFFQLFQAPKENMKGGYTINVESIDLRTLTVTDQSMSQLFRSEHIESLTSVLLNQEQIDQLSSKVLDEMLGSKNLTIKFNYQTFFNKFKQKVGPETFKVLQTNLVAYASITEINLQINLEDKSIVHTDLSGSFIELLSKPLPFSYLKVLNLAFNLWVDDIVMTEMVKSKNLQSLVSLNVYGTRITSTGAAMVLTAKEFSQEFDLEQYLLNISDKIDGHIIQELPKSPFLKNVATLNLEGASSSKPSFSELYESKFLKNVKHLNFRNAGFTDADLSEISRYPFFEHIETLLIGSSLTKHESIILFLEGKYFNYNTFNFTLFLKDIVSSGGQQIIDVEFFQKFVQTDYFNYGLTYLDIQYYIDDLNRNHPLSCNRIVDVFVNQGQSKTFNITSFLMTLPPQQKMRIDDRQIKQLDKRYLKLFFMPLSEFQQITYGVNFLLSRQGILDGKKKNNQDQLLSDLEGSPKSPQKQNGFFQDEIKENQDKPSGNRVVPIMKRQPSPWMDQPEPEAEHYPLNARQNEALLPSPRSAKIDEAAVTNLNMEKLREIYSQPKYLVKQFPVHFKIAYLLTNKVQQVISMAAVDQIIVDYRRLGNPEIFKMIKILDFGGNNFLSTFGLTMYIQKHVQPWNQVNDRILRQGKQSHFSVLKPDHNIDDSNGYRLSELLRCLKGLREVNYSDLNLGDEFAIECSKVLADPENCPHLTMLNLEDNNRLTQHGLKYLYTAIINRVLTNREFDVKVSEPTSRNKQKTVNLQHGASSRSRSGAQTTTTGRGSFMPQNQTFSQRFSVAAQNMFGVLTGDRAKDERSWAQRNIDDREQNDEEENLIQNELTDQDEEINEQGINQNRKRQDANDSKKMFLAFVNMGLYNTINYIYGVFFKFQRKLLITIALLCPWFSIFHLIKLLLTTVADWVTLKVEKIMQVLDEKMSERDPSSLGCGWKILRALRDCIRDTFVCHIYVERQVNRLITWWKSGQKENVIEVKKNFENAGFTVNQDQFYFDADVIKINKYLSGDEQMINKTLESNLKELKQKIPPEQEPQLIRIWKEDRDKKFYVIKHLELFLLLNFFIYHALCLIYPFLVLPDDCTNPSFLYDWPYYIYFLCATIGETMFLLNIQDLINCKQIFNFWSIETLLGVYGSQMSKYDLYTDMSFVSQSLQCEELHAADLGIVTGVILSFNLFFSFVQFFSGMSKLQYVKKQFGKVEGDTTSFINEYTKLTFISDYMALGQLLDRFSTSSTIKLEQDWYIPQWLSGVYVPQLLMTKFQRVFFEDLPQIFIQIVYQLSRQGSFVMNTQNIKVIVTSILNLISTLNRAWDAKPSSFTEKHFNDYIKYLKSDNNSKTVRFWEITYEAGQEEAKRASIAKIDITRSNIAAASQQNLPKKSKFALEPIKRKQTEAPARINEEQDFGRSEEGSNRSMDRDSDYYPEEERKESVPILEAPNNNTYKKSRFQQQAGISEEISPFEGGQMVDQKETIKAAILKKQKTNKLVEMEEANRAQKVV